MARIISERSSREMWHLETAMGTTRSSYVPHLSEVFCSLFRLSDPGFLLQMQIAAPPCDGSCLHKCMNKVMRKHTKMSHWLCLGERKCNLNSTLRIMKNTANTEHLLRAMNTGCAVLCTRMLNVSSRFLLQPLRYYAHFTDEETESENIICFRSQSW